jgi:hypothetical protein
MENEARIQEWNESCPEGTEVVVRKEIRGGKTIGNAFMHRDKAVILIEGLVGPVPLEMVRAAK